MTHFLLEIVTHTPTWVWVILGVLVVRGVQQMRTQDVSAQRMVVMPLVLCAYSAYGAWTAFGAAGPGAVVVAWAVGAMLGYAANAVLDMPRRVSANPDGSFRVAGSFAPLVLFLSIFLLRYVIGVALAIVPTLAQDMTFTLVASLVCGVPSGLLVARSRKVLATRHHDEALIAA